MRRLFGVIVLTCMVGLAVTGCTQSSVGPSTNSSPGQGAASQGATPAPSAAATSQSTSGSPSASPTEGAQPTEALATLAKFNKVKDGMTYAEVLKIMGGPGKKIGESASGDIHVAMYGWYGADPMNVAVVSFLNGAVNAKQQQGLK